MRDKFFNNAKINSEMKHHLEKELGVFNKIKYVYAIMSKSNPANLAIIDRKSVV